MKCIPLVVAILIGVCVGRWSVETTNVGPVQLADFETETAVRTISKECQQDGTKAVKVVEQKSQPELGKIAKNDKFLRTGAKKKNHQIQKLFRKILEAKSVDNLEAQNKAFKEMLALNPNHYLVFQIKSMFLDEDQDWQGSYENLKACVNANSKSVYCHRRLANIRSSSDKEKIKHAKECLKIKPDSQFCVVDLAIAYHKSGLWEKAKKLYEQALSLPRRPDRFYRRYILYNYGLTLESLLMEGEAVEALSESCELQFKPACNHLEVNRKVTS